MVTLSTTSPTDTGTLRIIFIHPLRQFLMSQCVKQIALQRKTSLPGMTDTHRRLSFIVHAMIGKACHQKRLPMPSPIRPSRGQNSGSASVRNCRCNSAWRHSGLVFGVLGMASGLSALQTILLSSILFGGASQVVFAQLLGSRRAGARCRGIGIGGQSAPCALQRVNRPYLRSLPLRWRVPLAYLLTDEAYAVTIHRLKTQPASPFQHYHLLGTGITLWICWQITTITGVVFGATIPESLSLGFAIPLTFIALVAPAIRDRGQTSPPARQPR